MSWAFENGCGVRITRLDEYVVEVVFTDEEDSKVGIKFGKLQLREMIESLSKFESQSDWAPYPAPFRRF